MNMPRSRNWLIATLALALPACGAAEKPVTVETGIEQAAKAAEAGAAFRKNQPKKPPAEPKRTGEDARFPGPD